MFISFIFGDPQVLPGLLRHDIVPNFHFRNHIPMHSQAAGAASFMMLSSLNVPYTAIPRGMQHSKGVANIS